MIIFSSNRIKNTHTYRENRRMLKVIIVGYLNTGHTSKIITKSSNKRDIVPIVKAPDNVDFNIRRSSRHRSVSLISSTDNRKNITPTLLREPSDVEITVRETEQDPTSETLKLRKWKTPFSFQRTPPQPTSLFIF